MNDGYFSKRGVWIASLLNSLFMLGLTYYWLQQNITYGDEVTLVKFTSILRRIVLGNEQKPDKKEVLFVNVSHDLILIDLLDDDGFPIGNQPIVDRTKLSEFLLKTKNRHRYILCDIFFKDASPSDSVLQAALNQTQKIVVSYHLNETALDTPIFKVNRGISDYETFDGMFFKFPILHQDSLPSTPLVLYHEIEKATYESTEFATKLNGHPVLNTFIVDFRVRPYDLFEAPLDKRYAVVNLGEMLMANDSMFQAMIQDKIVILGDFYEHDIHETFYGDVPGPLILYNVFLDLRAGDNIISPFISLFLLIIYLIFSYNIFATKKLQDRRFFRILYKLPLGKFFIEYLSNFLFLGIASIACYFIFNIHLNILLLGLYLNGFDYVFSAWEAKKIQARERKKNAEQPEISEI